MLPESWRGALHISSFFSEILDFIYSTVLIFNLIYLEWCDTENQQLAGAENVQAKFERFDVNV